MKWTYDEELRANLSMISAGDNHVVCGIPNGMTPEEIKQQREDAKLIQAAPELLEACKYVVKYHREHDSGEGGLFGLDFVTTCIAAIARAEGR